MFENFLKQLSYKYFGFFRPIKVKMGLKIMGFNGAKLKFMFENFPLTTVMKIIWNFSPIKPHLDSKKSKWELK